MKWMRYLAAAMALLMTVALCGCSLLGGKEKESSEEESSEVEMDPEYPVEAASTTLSARPGMVVSLAPSLSEKLGDLGMADRLVGISDYCDYPGNVLDRPRCGTAQLPDLDEIERLAPHLILTETALGDDVMEQLNALDIPVAVLPHAESVDALLQNYTDLARLMEGKVAGAAIGDVFAGEYRSRLNSLQKRIADYTAENGRKKVLYLRLLDYTVATGDTFENEMLDYIGLDNIAVNQSGWEYPEEAAKGAEGLAAFQSVDIIYMDDAFVTIKMLEGSAYYKNLPAVLKDRYLYINSIAMERQSMRSIDLLNQMAAYAYPEVITDSAAPPADGEDGDGEDELVSLGDTPDA